MIDEVTEETIRRLVVAYKARRIAESLKLALFFRPDRSWPEDLRQRPKVSGPCT
jgi:hypothetical protein